MQQILGEGDLPSGNELINLITDDSLMVKLFIEKLKLTFSKDTSDSLKETKMREQIAKEIELIEQLNEIKEHNAALAADPKAKKGGNKGGKTEEQVNEEIDQVTKI